MISSLRHKTDHTFQCLKILHQVGAVAVDLSFKCGLKSADGIHQRSLSRAGSSDNRYKLISLDLTAYPVQDPLLLLSFSDHLCHLLYLQRDSFCRRLIINASPAEQKLESQNLDHVFVPEPFLSFQIASV